MSQSSAQTTSFPNADPDPKRFSPVPRRYRAVGSVIVLTLSLVLFLWYIGVFGGNVRTVVPGRVYRSAEITGDTLARVLEQDHIKTVINLRGGSPSDSWYQSELAETARYGARHLDVALSATHYPPPDRLQTLMSDFDRADYPVLFHCRGGADRSGLAATLYLNVYQHVPLDQAEERGLTWRYAHFSFGQAHAMNDFFNLYRKTARGQTLRDWITKSYPDLYAHLPASLQTKP